MRDDARRRPAAGAVLPDGTVAEMVYCPEEGRTSFVLGEGEDWRAADEIELAGELLVPFSPPQGSVSASCSLAFLA